MTMKLYSDTSIQAIADAIREKNGLTTTYKISEMAAAITAIQSGVDINGFAEGTQPSGDIVLDTATSISDYVFMDRSITSISGNFVLSIGDGTFYNCTALTSVSFPVATSIGFGAFRHCSALTSVSFPAATSIEAQAFDSCSALTKLKIESTTVCTLTNIDTFSSTPIASGAGYIYVPDTLVDSYKITMNWSTYANQIKPISEWTE